MSRLLPCTLKQCTLFCAIAFGRLLSPATTVAAPVVNPLQSLVNDTAMQIQLAYQRRPDECTERREELAAVIAAWRSADRTDANNARLATWLHMAIAVSMPGSREPLPPVPGFETTAKSDPRAASRSVLRDAAAKVGTKNDADPFRDDPAAERD